MKQRSYFSRLLNASASTGAPVLRPPRALFRASAASVDLQMPSVIDRPPARPVPVPASQMAQMAGTPPPMAASVFGADSVAVEAGQEQAKWPASATAEPAVPPRAVEPQPSMLQEPPPRAQPKPEIRNKAAVQPPTFVRSPTAEPGAAAPRHPAMASSAPSGGLKIGTIEVHVAAPPGTPTQTKPPKPRPPARHAASQRIARPFAAFGLRQS